MPEKTPQVVLSKICNLVLKTLFVVSDMTDIISNVMKLFVVLIPDI